MTSNQAKSNCLLLASAALLVASAAFAQQPPAAAPPPASPPPAAAPAPAAGGQQQLPPGSPLIGRPAGNEAAAKLAAQVAGGRNCPRKFLINAHTHLLDQPDPRALDNVNTLDEYAKAMTAIDLPAREIRVRARGVRGERLLKAIDLAYGEKYDTKASLKWVRGFARGRRRLTTIELHPR